MEGYNASVLRGNAELHTYAVRYHTGEVEPNVVSDRVLHAGDSGACADAANEGDTTDTEETDNEDSAAGGRH